MRFIIPILLFTLSAVAQPRDIFNWWQQAAIPAEAPSGEFSSPADLDSVAFWYLANDLTNTFAEGANTVTNWPD